MFLIIRKIFLICHLFRAWSTVCRGTLFCCCHLNENAIAPIVDENLFLLEVIDYLFILS